MRYETEQTEFGTNIRKIADTGQVYFIPIDLANSDYHAYLEHLTENPTEVDE